MAMCRSMAIYSSDESMDDEVDLVEYFFDDDASYCAAEYDKTMKGCRFERYRPGPNAKEASLLTWMNLKPGVLSHPAPLELQCLMFVIGHLFQPDHSVPVSMIALLPCSIRIKLLLLLPAVDVHKLEGTSFTRDILMDEIWETLYNERIPLRFKNIIESTLSNGLVLETPDEYIEKYDTVVTWKEAYFDTVFSLLQNSNNFTLQRNDQGCLCGHFMQDLLYGIGKGLLTTEIANCFRKEATLCIHGVYHYAVTCFTTANHHDKFAKPRGYVTDTLVADMVNVLVDSNIFLKKLTLLDDYLVTVIPYLENPGFVDKLTKLLCSVEILTISYESAITEDLDDPLNKILSILFPPGRPSVVKSVTLINEFKVPGPHLIGRNLKHLGISLYLGKETVLSAKSSTRWSNLPVSIRNNISRQITEVIESQKEIESFTFTPFTDDFVEIILLDNDLIQCVYNVLRLPSLRKFKFDASQHQVEVSSVILLNLLALFLSSPYPLSFTLSLSCPLIDRQPKPLTANPVPLKTLEINGCTFPPHLLSFLPQHLVLKSLKLQDNKWSTVSFFTNLQSITVEELVLHSSELMTNDDVKTILSLFRIVTAKEWKLGLNIEDKLETLEALSHVLTVITSKSSLHSFCFLNEDEFALPPMKGDTAVSIVKTIFNSLSHSKPSYFDFAISENLLQQLKDIQYLWEDCGKIKMKSIRVFGIQLFDHDYYRSILGGMTEKLDLCNKID